MTDETISERVQQIMANWANALPEQNRLSKTWKPEEFNENLPTSTFNVEGFQDVSLLRRLRTDLDLLATPRWGKNFGEIIAEIEGMPRFERGIVVNVDRNGGLPLRPAGDQSDNTDEQFPFPQPKIA